MKVDLYDMDQFVTGVPHDVFDWLRVNEPVYFNPEPDGPGFWNLTRYEDVAHASKDWMSFTSAKGTNIIDPEGGYELAMVNQDPPAHTRLRTLVNKGFLPKMITRIEPHVRDIT
ncbi:MAG: cytochrome P450, partial [Actinomycetota bacterium]